MEQTYFRKGFGLKREIEGELASDYHSRLVDHLRAHNHALTVGPLTIRLAREFGFCYGVDRAVEMAYETRRRYPDKRLFLVGEIIHNPHVNRRLTEMGVAILGHGADGEFDFSNVTAADVVLMPAFGVTVRDFDRLEAIGCVRVDTTCGSVLNVWKRVERYAGEGFTSLVHGKYYHEETKATVSQVTKFPGGRYLIVRDMAETEAVCEFIETGQGVESLRERFGHAVSAGFDFASGLARVGVANQTTMLAQESLAIAARVRDALTRRFGVEHIAEHFRNFDTICSATQERQDAIIELVRDPLDVMVVIGGYNSSNTISLARICAEHVRTYHIEDAACIDPAAGAIRHQPPGSKEETEERGWLTESTTVVGITAGASTPNNKIGETIERVLLTKGLRFEEGGG